MKKVTKKTEKKSVEDDLGELEKMVSVLENENVDLTKSFDIFKKAVKVSRDIQKKLNDYEKEIKILYKNANIERKK